LYYVAGRSNNNLYRVNPATGASSLIGAHGIADMFALGYHPPSDALYGVSIFTDMLYRLNPITGAATLVGPTGAPYISGLTWDSVRDEFVGIDAFSGDFYTVNVTTGAATLLAGGLGTVLDVGVTYDPTSDLFWVVEGGGNVYTHDPTAGYARTAVGMGGYGVNTAVCYAPLPDPIDPPTAALLANTAYVDYIAGNSDAEASNVQASLESFGFTVNTFTDISAAGLTAALAGAQILAMPEFEMSDPTPALTAPARAAIVSFVENGGTLLVFYPATAYTFVNTLFGYALTGGVGTAPFAINAAAAAGTSFQGGPASIPSLSATSITSGASLPLGSRQVYGGSVVTVIPRGAGDIILIGWDWFDAAPTGAQDGGWVAVLKSAGLY
jgi:hypothetical protein